MYGMHALHCAALACFFFGMCLACLKLDAEQRAGAEDGASSLATGMVPSDALAHFFFVLGQVRTDLGKLFGPCIRCCMLGTRLEVASVPACGHKLHNLQCSRLHASQKHIRVRG